MPAASRMSKCIDCGEDIMAGATGPLPKRCAADVRRHLSAKARRSYRPKLECQTGVCVDCGETYAKSPRATTRVRCTPCRTAYGAESRRLWAAENPEKTAAIKRKWFEANRGYVKSAKHHRRVIARDAAADRFTPQEIFERDGWLCHLCGLAVDPSAKFPSNESPSMDHVIPIARGGTHTLDNVRLAHMGCNRRKGAR